MMTAEIRINGALIGYVYIHNRGMLGWSQLPENVKGNDVCRYYVEYYEVGSDKVHKSECLHSRANGAMALLKIACEQITKKKPKKEKKR
jgi:hypothetical protein